MAITHSSSVLFILLVYPHTLDANPLTAESPVVHITETPMVERATLNDERVR